MPERGFADFQDLRADYVYGGYGDPKRARKIGFTPDARMQVLILAGEHVRWRFTSAPAELRAVLVADTDQGSSVEGLPEGAALYWFPPSLTRALQVSRRIPECYERVSKKDFYCRDWESADVPSAYEAMEQLLQDRYGLGLRRFTAPEDKKPLILPLEELSMAWTVAASAGTDLAGVWLGGSSAQTAVVNGVGDAVPVGLVPRLGVERRVYATGDGSDAAPLRQLLPAVFPNATVTESGSLRNQEQVIVR